MSLPGTTPPQAALPASWTQVLDHILGAIDTALRAAEQREAAASGGGAAAAVPDAWSATLDRVAGRVAELEERSRRAEQRAAEATGALDEGERAVRHWLERSARLPAVIRRQAGP